VMLIWGTTAWIRSGEPFNIDFEGYPKYMRQVRNHPSIVMWEASNHPNRFKDHDIDITHRWVKKVYDTIYSVDPSRIISLSSFIRHTHYGNDAGTLDYEGKSIRAVDEWIADKVTRGNQDSATGYGKEWSVIRTWPGEYYRDMLDSRDRAYFNFEHQESIGQPNWEFTKGKPWHKLHSYEWPYDEGSIGRKLTTGEWEESQAWQAFSAWEAIKKQRLVDYDGFSWCCLHGGPNSGTYQKPLMDCDCRAKLSYWTNKMAFQRVIAGSGDVDIVYGPEDRIAPVVMNLGDARTVDVGITVRDQNGAVVGGKSYTGIGLPGGRTVTKLPDFRPAFPAQGYYAVEYRITGAGGDGR